MKTLLLSTIIFLTTFQTLNAQLRVKGDAIYFYCSASTQNTQEGIERYEDPKDDNDPLFAHRPITFEMRSKPKKHLYTFHPLQL